MEGTSEWDDSLEGEKVCKQLAKKTQVGGSICN